MIDGQTTVKRAIKAPALKQDTRQMTQADISKSASKGGSSAQTMTIKLRTSAERMRNASCLVTCPPIIWRNAAKSAAKPAKVTDITARLYR
jgi:hypothetical protein